MITIKNENSLYIDKNIIIGFLFLLYFCSEIFTSIYVRVFGNDYGSIVYNCIFLSCLAIYVYLFSFEKLWPAVFVYCVVAILFIFTAFVHPEYHEWFWNESYGVQVQFFCAMGGIWAFLILSINDDRDKLFKYLLVAAWLLFVFFSLRYLSAAGRGYWVEYDAQGRMFHSSYNLGFGYLMLFPVSFFAAYAFLCKKKLYYIPYIIGLFMILTGGSRGAILWALLVPFFCIPYRWKQYNNRIRTIIILIGVCLIPIAFFCLLYYDQLLRLLAFFLADHNISSRTLDMLLSGDIKSANGRDDIAELAIDRIKEGGLFGNGVFGERIAVGQQFRWGYAHNVFLEMYAAFGYVGATVILAGLLYKLIRCAINRKTATEQVIFITFFACSMKLLISDSFWFNSSFWALLAIMFLWKNDDTRDDKVTDENPFILTQEQNN